MPEHLVVDHLLINDQDTHCGVHRLVENGFGSQAGSEGLHRYYTI